MSRIVRGLRAAIVSILAVGLVVGAPVASATAAEGTGVISGTVTLPNSQPASGVLVQLFRWVGGLQEWDILPEGKWTDAAGEYSWDELEPGTYTVGFNPQDGATLYEFWDGRRDLEDADTIELGDGETFVADASLDPAATISGTVTRPGGAPVADVEVAASRIGGNGSTHFTTNAQGEYTVTGLRAGDWTLQFRPPPGSDLAREYWNDAAIRSEADVISVATGQTLDDFDVELAVGGTLSGVVSGDGTGPIEGAIVQLEPLEEDTGASTHSVSTDAAGAYTIIGISPTEYRLRFSAASQGFAHEYWEDEPDRSEATPLVFSGQSLVRNATLAVGATFSGTVSPEPEYEGTPLTAFVDAQRLDADGSWQHIASANAEPDGDFTVQGLAPGTYRFLVSAGGNWAWRYIGGAYLPDDAQTFTISGSTAYSGNDVELEPGVFIRATWYDDDGGVPKRPVWAEMLWEKSPGEWVVYRNGGASGDFALANRGNMAPGNYAVRFVDRDGGAGAYVTEYWEDAPTIETATVLDGQPGSQFEIEAYLSTDPFVLSPTPVPTIAGTPEVGTQLTATPGTWGPSPVTLAYQWLADGEAIAGATSSTFTPTADELGAQLTVTVTGSKPGYPSVERTSEATAAVAEGTLSPAPTPTITGATTVGSTLTAVPGTWGPAPVSLAYEWRADGEAIPGATSATFDLTAAQVGAEITVAVTGSKTGYEPLTRVSAATDEVAAGTLSPAPTPTISGTAKVGSTLTATPGTWGPAPVALAYEWRADGEAIPGATSSTLELTAAQVGAEITVAVTGSKTGYEPLTRVSAATDEVAAGTLSPAPTPTISGTAKVGSTLTATPGTWGPAPVALAYEWRADGEAIPGATSSTFQLTADQAGSTVTVAVTGSKEGYEPLTRESAPTGVVANGTLSPAPTPTISGTPQVGSTLTAVPGTWGPAPVSLAYEWRAGGTPIPGATSSTFELTAAQVGATITVAVTGSKDGYDSVTRVSAATAAVAPEPSGEVVVERLSGADRYATAVAVSQRFDPEDVTRVYLASGAGFADALSAGPVAAHVSAPLLLTAPGGLPPVVRAELERLEPDEVVIVGGTGAVSVTVANQVAALGASVERIGGANRYETARNLIMSVFGDDGAETAYIATGADFPDALAAGPAAAHFDGPVVLVPGTAKTVDAATLGLLADLGVDRIRIAGGTGVVSTAIQSQLAGIYGASDVTRTSGSGRYQTAVAINAAEFETAPVAYLATGSGFADALAGAALAGRDGAPLFISTATCIPAEVLATLDDMGTTTLVLLGGSGVLSQKVEQLTSC